METNDRQLVIFSLGGEEYALPISAVHEIIRHTEPRSVASASGNVRGVISLRGKIIPVIDLASSLGTQSTEQVEGAKIVIVEAGSDMVGVIVDDVEEVLTVQVDQIDPVPARDSSIEAIAKIGDRLVGLLDPDGVFGDARSVVETV
jgi:purine-binding chemotaxis protein CheW